MIFFAPIGTALGVPSPVAVERATLCTLLNSSCILSVIWVIVVIFILDWGKDYQLQAAQEASAFPSYSPSHWKASGRHPRHQDHTETHDGLLFHQGLPLKKGILISLLVVKSSRVWATARILASIEYPSPWSPGNPSIVTSRCCRAILAMGQRSWLLLNVVTHCG